MKQNKWSRKDVHDWWREQRKQMLSECGCEDESYSVYGKDIYTPEESFDIKRQVLEMNNQDSAICPESYSKSAQVFCDNPHEILQALRPLMRQIGVGCPQSFAMALTDMFEVAMETGVIKPFNTDDLI
ncbi:MAG: hypothetical protein CBC29_06805 [Methylococcaceae bacterium TMED69]|nr:MAG: hypothetical protein CBC29_06805 [Methylococcaceae bacterium TMED69]|tara:strand:- start:538 stop:921 length:384 start_codon:yes stop_codon:yes gene_type:complete